MNWNLLTEQIPQNEDELLDLILDNREIKDHEKFLNPYSAYDLKLTDVGVAKTQIKKAKKILETAVADQQDVLIFGDYDADGICATSILWLFLQKMGLTARPFIPDRQEHGYGITQEVLEEIFADKKPDVMITVDNGIVAHKAVEYAQEQGVTVLVTDHHQADKKLPPAEAVVHSTEICGAAVAWLLAREIDQEKAKDLLDLAALATVSDQMPLIGPNRSLLKDGLLALQTTQRPGLQALYQVAKVDPKMINTYTVGFVIAPRINAAGRLETGIVAVRLLCTQKLSAARQIARHLNQVNAERQDLTSKQLRLAYSYKDDWQKEKLIFVFDNGFHEGIIGLVAGKLTERHHRPSIVMGIDGDVAKASVRSVKGIHITNLLRKAEDLMLSCGGHEMAAGFSVSLENLEQLKDKLMELADEVIDDSLLEAELDIDCQLPAELINQKTVAALTKLEPYGMGHHAPVFMAKNLQLVQFSAVGREKKHLRMQFKLPDSVETVNGIGWNLAYKMEDFEQDQEVDLVGNMEINHWNGNDYLQFKLKDVKPSE